MRPHAPSRVPPTVLGLALAAAFAPALAEDKDADKKDKSVEASFTIGPEVLGGSSQDRALFSQYGSLPRNQDFGVWLAFDYSLRDPGTNTWFDFGGTDLLGDQRELGAVWKRPGDWRVRANYSELVWRDPRTVNSGMVGFGSPTPTVVPLPGGPGTGAEYELKTKRTALGVSLSKWISPSFQLELDVKHEDKEGARLFGRGFTCPSTTAPTCGFATGIATGSAVLLLPEPIDSSHNQVEARASYAYAALRFSVGYYGSFYTNNLSTLSPNIPGSLYNPVGSLLPLSNGLQAILGQPIALPPDNQAHQLDLTGTYDFSTTTRLAFKYAIGRATQNDNFSAAGLTGAPAGVTSLDGRVDTKLVKLGLTSRPMPKLSLLADVRYEDRDDRTPIAPYNIEGTATYTNRQLPYKKLRAKAQGTWQFTSDWRGTLGADYENIDRGVFTASSAVSGLSALRQKTTEVGAFGEVRKRISEDVSGALRFSSTHRDGSNWLRDNSGLGVTEIQNPTDPATGLPSTAILMPTLADRRRDKVKLFVDWQPTEPLALQLSVETGRDRYDQLMGYGLHDTRMGQASIDGSYAVNDKWNVTAFGSAGSQALNQSRPFGYVMALRNTTWTAGLGVNGKPKGNLEVGGGLSFIDDNSAYRQTLDPLASPSDAALLAASGGLPDIVFRQTQLRLYSRYTVDKQSTVRVDLIFQHSHWTDWAWGHDGVPFTYSDGTTVMQKATQRVTFLGLTYRHEFQ